MTDSREVLGVWAFEGVYAPRNREHKKARTKWVWDFFGGEKYAPAFIWKLEFFRTVKTPRSNPEQYEYGVTLHRYASNAEGKRHMVWVKMYDERGEPQSKRLVAAVEPENYRTGSLPPEWLLLGNPKPSDYIYHNNTGCPGHPKPEFINGKACP